MRRQAGFFDVDDRLKRLSDLGDGATRLPKTLGRSKFGTELTAIWGMSV
jgi:hypothetical protein